MEAAADHIAHNQETFEQLLFALHHRDTPTLVFISVDNDALRDSIMRQLEQELTEYQFYHLDATPDNITSLHRFLQEKLPPDILVPIIPPKYAVHLTGLENSLIVTQDDRLVYSSLVAQMNFERELLFRDVPYITLLWAPKDFLAKLNKDAPDLSHWVTYQFGFACGPEEKIDTPDFRYETKLQVPGNLPQRRERIETLQAQLHKLDIGVADKTRLIRDKIGLLTEIGDEYKEMQRYGEAIAAYEEALPLSLKLPNEYSTPQLYFELGGAYIEKRLLAAALESYQACLNICLANEDVKNTGAIYHQIGRVYEAQRKWADALASFQKAIGWYEKTGNEYGLGGTWHQIGRVYEEQRKWADALASYYKAIERYEKTGNEYGLGGTWHQIGMVHAEQHKWADALTSYQKAIEWKEKTGNEYALGDTWHQIGMVNEEQHKWADALTSYHKAIEWKEKTGNEYQLGASWNQIGIVYARQRKWADALTSYHKAIEWKEKTGNEYQLGASWHQIGMVNEEQELWDEALLYYTKATDQLKAVHHIPHLNIATISLARALAKLGRWEDVISTGNEALLLNAETKDEANFVKAMNFLNQAYAITGHPDLQQALPTQAATILRRHQWTEAEIEKILRQLEELQSAPGSSAIPK